MGCLSININYYKPKLSVSTELISTNLYTTIKLINKPISVICKQINSKFNVNVRFICAITSKYEMFKVKEGWLLVSTDGGLNVLKDGLLQ